MKSQDYDFCIFMTHVALYSSMAAYKMWFDDRHGEICFRERSVTVVSARGATMDWFWLKECNWCARADLHSHKRQKAQAGIYSLKLFLQKNKNRRIEGKAATKATTTCTRLA